MTSWYHLNQFCEWYSTDDKHDGSPIRKHRHLLYVGIDIDQWSLTMAITMETIMKKKKT